jgi:DNA-binding IclR family transcriptional regulator
MRRVSTANAPAVDNHGRYMVPGLERGLRLLELVSHSAGEVNLSDAARALGISRSSAFRLVYTLENMGYLRRGSDERKFRLGPQVLRLGSGLLAGLDIVDLAQKPLEELRSKTGASAHLAVRDGTDILYVISLPGRQRITTNIHVGTRLPAYATSMGRILLSDLEPQELRELYKGARLKAFTEHTPTSVGRLAEAVKADAERGHVVSRGHFEPEIWSIAAPVFDHTGRITAAISVTYPSSVVDRGTFEGATKEQTCQAARDISALLGHRAHERASAAPERTRNARAGS